MRFNGVDFSDDLQPAFLDKLTEETNINSLLFILLGIDTKLYELNKTLNSFCMTLK